MSESSNSFTRPFRIDAQAHAFHIFVVLDAEKRIVREMDNYDEAVRYVAEVNGTSIEVVRSEVARQMQMYEEYMQNLKANRKVGHASNTIVTVSQTTRPTEAPNSEKAVAAARQLLDLTRRGDEPDSLQLVIGALQGSEDVDQYAFYLGKPRRPLDDIWGDNDRSFVAEICCVPIGDGETAYIVNLTQDGGISRYLGTFSSEHDALKCLARHGKFEKP